MKKAFLIMLMMVVCGNALAQLEAVKEPIVLEPVEKAQDYWVYVRLEDRSGVTPLDDAGRSKAGDVVAVLPVTPQHIPSETEKKEWMIYKTSLTETERQAFLEEWTEPTITKDGEHVTITKAYRKNKLDTSKLGVAVSKGLVAEKIDASKIETSAKTSFDLSRYEMKRKFYAYVQRPLKIVSNKIIGPAFAETVSTINKTGEDYNTLTLWEDAVDGDLVTEMRQETAECYDDDGALTDGFTVDGSTTNESYYIKITAPDGERHNGEKISDGSSGNGFLLKNTTANHIISPQDNYTEISWLQITSPSGIRQTAINPNAATNIVIKNNIIANITISRGAIRNYTGATSTTIVNNLVYNIAASESQGFCIRVTTAGSSLNVANNTVYNCESGGFDAASNSITESNTYTNNISMGNTGADFSIGTPKTTSSRNNMSEDDTGDNCGSYNLIEKVVANQFVSVSSGSENFHLKVGSDAINAGADLSAVFTTDIDGETRPTGAGTWDIGADEYVSATRRRMIFIN